MWFMRTETGKSFVVFGKPFPGTCKTAPPAVIKAPGKRPFNVGEFTVYTSGELALFMKRGGDTIEEAFMVGGVKGIKRLLFKIDVYEFVAGNFGISRKRLKNIIRTSNAVDFVPYFNISTKDVHAVLDLKRPKSVETVKYIQPAIMYYNGLNVYRYPATKNKLEVLHDLLSGRLSGAVEPRKESIKNYDPVLADAGVWYMMFGEMFIVGDNMLFSVSSKGVRMLYPYSKKMSPEEALVVLEHGLGALQFF